MKTKTPYKLHEVFLLDKVDINISENALSKIRHT